MTQVPAKKKYKIVKHPKQTNTQGATGLFEDAIRLAHRARRDAKAQTDVSRIQQGIALGLWDRIVGKRAPREYRVRDDDAQCDIDVTYVQATRSELDGAALKQKLGGRIWKKVTKDEVDIDLLEQAVKDGLIDPAIVQSCMVDKQSAPYLKLTARPDAKKGNTP